MRTTDRFESKIRRLRQNLEALLGSKHERPSDRPRKRNLLGGVHSRFEPLEQRIVLSATIGNNIAVGTQLQNYRIAIAATAEYTALLGGQSQAFNAIQSFVDDTNEIFEKELAIHFDLVSTLNTVFTNASTDGYTNGNTNAMLSENTARLDAIIGNANYDIGHVFGTYSSGGSGLAGLGVVSNPSRKGEGASVSSNPQGADWVKLVGHELAHQFGAEHTFNANAFGSAVGNRSGDNAYEPASGTTLMSYAGISGADDLQPDPDPYFHGASFEQVQTYISSSALPHSITALANSIPTVSGGSDYTIPAGTPFQLTAVGADADVGDSLTYTWEQLDTGPAMSLPLFDNGSSPLFRSVTPLTNPTRVFPRLSDLANSVNTAAIGEVLPSTNRDLNFRATVRDGNSGVNSDDVLVSVVDTGTPFAITSPNGTENWTGGTTQTVTWDVAGTDSNGINVTFVGIDLSLDGGLTYPMALESSTVNDGSHVIIVPNIPAANARIRVRANGNLFFDISNNDFAITPNSATPGFTVTESSGNTLVGEDGLVGGQAVDSYTIARNTSTAGTTTVSINADAQTEVSIDNINFASIVSVDLTSTAPATIYVRGFDDTIEEGIHSGAITHTVTASTDNNYPTNTLIIPVNVTIVDDELQPLIGVDFDQATGNSPANWTLFSNSFNESGSNLIREDGVITSVGLTLIASGGSGLNPSTPAATPFHSPDLSGIDGVHIASNSLTLNWTGLIPLAQYNVYLLAAENFSNNFIQEVSITNGPGSPITFIQDSSPLGNALLVNSGIANPAKTIETDAVVVQADGAGAITIVATNINPTGAEYAYLSAAAIQAIAPPEFALTVSIDSSSISESGGSSTATVTRNDGTNGNLTVNLTSSDTGEATVPATVVIPDGSDSATFTVTGVDDVAVDGTQTVTITATATSYADGTDTLDVTDDDVGSLTVDVLASAISENAGNGATTATITRTGDTTESLDLILTSHDTSEMTVQPTVTIPVGQLSVTVNLNAVDDSYLDGTQTVSISAVATTYNPDITPDTTFDLDGSVTTSLVHNISPTSYDIKIQPDGKILAVGRVTALDDSWQIIRLNADGSVDTTFGSSGTATTTFTGLSSVRPGGILLGTDGRITVIGQTGAGSAIARYTSTGALDTSFSGDGKFEISSSFLRTGVVHPDGSITAVGAKSGNPSSALVRIKNDGTLDSAFGTAGVVSLALDPVGDERFTDVVQQADGKWLVAGTATFSGANARVLVARFNLDGTIDTTYGTSSGYTLLDVQADFLSINSIALTPEGGVVVFGDAFLNSDWLLAKFDANGVPDSGFTGDGYTLLDFNGASDNGEDIIVQEDGKFLAVGGGFVIGNGTDRAVARFNSNGTLDTSFSGDGFEIFAPLPGTFENIEAAALTNDGKLVTFSGYNQSFFVERWNLPSGLGGSDSVDVTDDDVVGVSPLVGMDFDNNGPKPNNWTTFQFLSQANAGNLLGEDGIRSTIDIDGNSIASSVITGAPTSTTIPQHTQSLANIGGYSFTTSTTDTFTATISDLVPGGEYRMYLFAHESQSGTYIQDVTFAGQNTVSFTQSLTQSNLFVNGSIGSSSNQLDSYAELVKADANGTILLTVAPSAGSAGITLSGLAIQRIVTSNDNLTVTIDSASMSENGGTSTATVSRNTGTIGDLTVNLTSDDTTEATVPATVVIPDGSDSVSFTVTAVDDPDFDGTQTVTISASATSFNSGSDTIDVTDDETAGLGPLIGIDIEGGSSSPTNWTLLSSLFDAGATQLVGEDGVATNVDVTSVFAGGSTSTRSLAPTPSSVPQHTQSLVGIDGVGSGNPGDSYTTTFSDLVPGAGYRVYVFGISDDFLLNFSNEVTITGLNIVSFSQALDNTNLYINGSVGSSSQDLSSYAELIVANAAGEITVTVTASAGADRFGVAGLAIQQTGNIGDVLTVSVDSSSISENGGTATGTVTRSSGTSGDLIVNLSTSDTSEATVPATVTIPNGSDSVSFSITGVDDTIIDGPQNVVISATATDFIGGTKNITVTDDEVAPPSLVGVDFGPSGSTPTNWSVLSTVSGSFTNMMGEDGNATPFDLAVSGFSGTDTGAPAANQLPIHSQSLAGINGNLYGSGTTATMIWSDLNPLNQYEVYVFGLDTLADNQTVTITGSGTPASFSQDFAGNQLFVNGTVGSNTLDLDSFAEIITPTVGGQITIAVNSGSFFGIGGIAIREIPLVTPSVSLTVSPSSALEDGANNLIYTFSRTGDTSDSLTVNFDVSGSGTFNSDYSQTGAATFSATTGTVTFNPGNATAIVTIDPTADSALEVDEEVRLTVAAGTGYDIGTVAPVIGSITNDDTATADLSVTTQGNEAGPVNIVYTVTLSKPNETGAPITFDFDDLGTGTAMSGSDYTAIANNTQISVANGSSTGTLTVIVTDDPTEEVTETLIAAISNSSNAAVTIGTASATANITDNDTPIVLTLDTEDTASTTLAGGWVPSSSVPGFDGANYVYAQPGANASATFTPTLPMDGQYEVFVKYSSHPNRASNASVNIVHADGMFATTMDQRTGGGVFHSVGLFNFSAGTTGKIFVDAAGSNGFVTADTVRFSRVGNVTEIPSSNLANPTSGQVLTATALNANGFIDVTYNAVSGLDANTLEDAAAEFTISGSGVGTAVISGAGVHQSGTTYRYSFTGTFVPGNVVVDFTPGSFANLGGTGNVAEQESFTLTDGLVRINMDNTDATQINNWAVSSAVVGYTGSDYLYTSAGGAGRLVYTPNVPADGAYEVFVNYTSGNFRASNAAYEIASQNGTTVVRIDQRTGGGTYQSLGTYNFLAGTSGSVTLRASDADGYVVGDAVQFVRAGNLTGAPSAALANPTEAASVVVTTINGQNFIDVTFADNSGSGGIDGTSITDAQQEFTLTGPGAAGVTVDGAGSLVSGTTYRYATTGSFVPGAVDAVFAAGTFADQSANLNVDSIASFVVVEDLLEEVIVDNSDSGFSLSGPTSQFVSSASVNGFVGSAYLAAPVGSTVTATWTPTLANSGQQYEVFVRYTSHPLRATNATYVVTHDGGTTQVTIDQTTGGGTWVSLGTFTLTSGTASVQLQTTGANQYVVADAVRFVLP